MIKFIIVIGVVAWSNLLTSEILEVENNENNPVRGAVIKAVNLQGNDESFVVMNTLTWDHRYFDLANGTYREFTFKFQQRSVPCVMPAGKPLAVDENTIVTVKVSHIRANMTTQPPTVDAITCYVTKR